MSVGRFAAPIVGAKEATIKGVIFGVKVVSIAGSFLEFAIGGV